MPDPTLPVAEPGEVVYDDAGNVTIGAPVGRAELSTSATADQNKE